MRDFDVGDLPDDFLAFLDVDGKHYCKSCVTRKQVAKAEDTESGATFALARDSWYDGGECAECDRWIAGSHEVNRDRS